MSGIRSWFGRGLDQDWVDSANGFWSVLLLALCSVGAFFMRYVSDPISCFTPKQFTVSHVTYAKSVCFAKEEVYVYSRQNGSSNINLTEPQTSYHLWVPLILLIQALCFKVPNIIWNVAKSSVTFNMDTTVSSLEDAQVANLEKRKVVVQRAAHIIAGLLKRNRFLSCLLYLFVKLLYCLNLFGQFVFLTIFVSQSLAIRASEVVGVDIKPYLTSLLKDNFRCDFDIQKMTNIHKFTIRCELSISESYEKMFVFLWYWVFLLGVVTFVNLLLWAGFLFLPFLRDRRISAHINASSQSPQDTTIIKRFVNSFLGIDGVLMLSMISRNSNELVAANLTQNLCQVFLEKEDQQPPASLTHATINDKPELKVEVEVEVETLSSKAPAAPPLDEGQVN